MRLESFRLSSHIKDNTIRHEHFDISLGIESGAEQVCCIGVNHNSCVRSVDFDFVAIHFVDLSFISVSIV